MLGVRQVDNSHGSPKKGQAAIEMVRIKKWGRLKIKAALRAKFLPAQSIHQALQQIDGEVYMQNLMDLIERKRGELSSEKDQQKKKAKLLRYLASNGYESDLIFDNLD